MLYETLTDEQIATLLAMPKRLKNAGTKEQPEAQHLRRDYSVVSTDGEQHFTLFTRQSIKVTNSFTAGLRWHAPSGGEVILMRCNGSDHRHFNSLEGQHIGLQCHIHIATERYIARNKKAEQYATATEAYNTMDDALYYLVNYAHIQDFPASQRVLHLL